MIDYLEWALETVEQAKDMGEYVTACAWTEDVPPGLQKHFVESLARFGITATPGHYTLEDIPCWRLAWGSGVDSSEVGE